jgi:hypothetical protein
MMEPEDLVNKVSALADMGEEIPAALFSGIRSKIIRNRQMPRAREAVAARIHSMDSETGVRIAWICYQAKAYDLACTLFLDHVNANKL